MRELARGVVVAVALAVAASATLRDGGPGATAQTANPPTCTAGTLGMARASNPGLAADCDTLLAIKPTLRVSGWIDYDAPSWRDHSYALNWSARSPLRYWSAVTLGGTPLRVMGLDFSDTRESVRVLDARTRRWGDGQPYTREWTLRGVIPTQLGNLTALEVLDLGGGELTGVVPTQLGSLTALTNLDLSNNSLTGDLPEALDALTALTRLRLAGNAFTRCAPHGLWAATSHDLATLGLPNCRPVVKYGAPQTTGVVDAAGEYAFFTDAGAAITTYEGLRNDVARVTIHEQDTAGTSWAWFYDDVEAGDLFEWRKANDCWVRYVVDEVLADPGATLKALSVEWMTYAFTGCSGTVAASVTGSMDWGALPDLGGTSLAVPVVHGPFQLVPENWTGATVAQTYQEPPGWNEANPVSTTDLATARRLPYWEEPSLPAGWVLRKASTDIRVIYGYCASWANDRGYGGVEICGAHATARGWPAVRRGPYTVYETRVIDGRPALVSYSPRSLPQHSRTVSIKLWIYDATTESEYTIRGSDQSLLGDNVDAVIAIARSLFEKANPQ